MDPALRIGLEAIKERVEPDRDHSSALVGPVRMSGVKHAGIANDESPARMGTSCSLG